MKPDYENNTLLYTLLSPIVWLHAEISRLTGYSMLIPGSVAYKTMLAAGTWKAIQMIYDYEHTSWYDDLYMNCLNGRALRNRRRLEAEVLRDLTKNIKTIVSLGCGSGGAVIDIMKEDPEVSVWFVDYDPAAIDAVRSKIPAGSHASYAVGDIRDFVPMLQDYREPVIVEIVGVIEYLSDEQVFELFKGIYNGVPAGSVIITSTIHDNPERGFITHAMKWPMKYRSRVGLYILIELAGFGEVRLTSETAGIHSIGTGVKEYNVKAGVMQVKKP